MASIELFGRPSRLFRYRGLSDNTISRELQAINNKYVFCALISQMNDPMEGSHNDSKLFKASATYKKKRKEITNIKSGLGIASFSESNDDHTMWAHYASNFSGICIAYRFGNLLRELTDEYQFVRMNYRDKAPALPESKMSPMELAKMVLSTKTSHWASEREWRLIAPSSGAASYQNIRCIAHVYLGSRIADSHKIALANVLRRLTIPFSTMKIGTYKILFEKDADAVRPKKAKANVKPA